MSSSSSSSYRRYNQDVSNKTHCDCKPPHPIPIQTAWTTDNPGRRFRGCPIRDKSKKCGVYGFLDLELPSDYYKGLVYSLHEENKALKRMNRMPVGVMDGTSGVVSNNSFGEKHLKSEFTFIKSKFKIYDRILFNSAGPIGSIIGYKFRMIETSSRIVSDEEIDKQKLEAHYSDMAKIQEVLPEESSSTSQPLEQVQNHDENDVFANVTRHSEQPESINDTYVFEKK
ncbi:hypothetical protein Tco_1384621 [Tanacetum coccineum]